MLVFSCMQDDFSLAMRKLQARYARLSRQLSALGWISEGYAQDRGPGAGGPCYQWTRKVRKKTVSVALSKEQFEWLSKKPLKTGTKPSVPFSRKCSSFPAKCCLQPSRIPIAVNAWVRKF